VWSMDITHIRLKQGLVYLCAVIDWYSLHVVSWRVSTALQSDLRTEALREAILNYGPPEIFYTDQPVTPNRVREALSRFGVEVSLRHLTPGEFKELSKAQPSGITPKLRDLEMLNKSPGGQRPAATHGTSLGAVRQISDDKYSQALAHAGLDDGGSTKSEGYLEKIRSKRHQSPITATSLLDSERTNDASVSGPPQRTPDDYSEATTPSTSPVLIGVYCEGAHRKQNTVSYSQLGSLRSIRTHKFLRGRSEDTAAGNETGADQGTRISVPGQLRTSSQPPAKIARSGDSLSSSASSGTSEVDKAAEGLAKLTLNQNCARCTRRGHWRTQNQK
jgi:hypothetical protein